MMEALSGYRLQLMEEIEQTARTAAFLRNSPFFKKFTKGAETFCCQLTLHETAKLSGASGSGIRSRRLTE